MDKTPKKPWFREYLKVDAESRLDVPFGKLDPTAQSKEMTKYYVRNVLSRIMPGLVPDDGLEVADSIVDGANDLGVDFISRSDGRVLIIQSKYRGSDKAEGTDSVSHFRDVLPRLYAAANKDRTKMKAALQEVVSDIDWEADYFYLQFLTLGKVGQNVRANADEGPNLIAQLPDLTDRVEFQFSDEQDLNEKLREALSAGETLEQEVPVHFRPNELNEYWSKLGGDSDRTMYVGQVSGSELADIYRTYKYRLFSLNIRDYVGDTATNKGIIETALENPENFLFFNNGVSAVASQIEEDPKSGALLCKRLSIINGAQTVRSLRKAQVKDKGGLLRTVRVLLRIIEFSLSKEHDFLADVTRFNNTQNSVKISDFRSNDPVQKDLARKFEGVVRGGKTYWYKNKRSREARDRVVAISLDELAKSIHAFRFGPDDIWGGTKYMFEVGPKGGYNKIFGEPVSHLTDGEFRLLAGTYFLCEEIRSLWEEEKQRARAKDENLNPALERRWMVYYTMGELLRLSYRSEEDALDSDIRKLSRPQWLDQADNPAKACLLELFEIAKVSLIQTYDASAKAENFRHRNWFRNETTLNDIRSTLASIPVFRGAKNPLPRLR
jgi:hypothetical protein